MLVSDKQKLVLLCFESVALFVDRIYIQALYPGFVSCCLFSVAGLFGRKKDKNFLFNVIIGFKNTKNKDIILESGFNWKLG